MPEVTGPGKGQRLPGRLRRGWTRRVQPSAPVTKAETRTSGVESQGKTAGGGSKWEAITGQRTGVRRCPTVAGAEAAVVGFHPQLSRALPPPRGAGIRPALTLPGAVQAALGIPRSGQPQPPLRAFLARVGYPRHTATPARPLDGWFCRCHVSYHRSHAPCPRIRRRARRRSRPRIPSPSSRTRTRTVRFAH